MTQITHVPDDDTGAYISSLSDLRDRIMLMHRMVIDIERRSTHVTLDRTFAAAVRDAAKALSLASGRAHVLAVRAGELYCNHDCENSANYANHIDGYDRDDLGESPDF